MYTKVNSTIYFSLTINQSINISLYLSISIFLLTILSLSSSTISMILANSRSDPPITISSSVWLFPIHSNLKRTRLLLRFLFARDKSAGERRATLSAVIIIMIIMIIIIIIIIIMVMVE